MRSKQRGFTLIELVLFIIITGILARTILVSFQNTLVYVPVVHKDLLATQLADECMEGFLGERRLLGYSSALLACSTTPTMPSICDPSASATITCTNTLAGDTTTSKIVTVSIAGTATLTMLMANY